MTAELELIEDPGLGMMSDLMDRANVDGDESQADLELESLTVDDEDDDRSDAVGREPVDDGRRTFGRDSPRLGSTPIPTTGRFGASSPRRCSMPATATAELENSKRR